MNEIHEKIYTLLKKLDKICRENSIEYYMLGGTMLGAIRHKGFIPWDDDADIGMPRSSYEKFIEIIDQYKDGEIELCNYRNTNSCPFAFSRLQDTSTTLIEKDRKCAKFVGGVYIDIFPLDGAPNNKVLRKILFKRVIFYKTILFALFTENNKETKRNIIKKVIINFLKMHVNMNKLESKIDRIIRKYDYNKSQYSVNYLGRWKEKESIEKNVMLPATEYYFEGIKLYGANNYDKYLTSLYGKDYMTPPKDIEKIGHHEPYYINLNLSYKKYNKMEIENKNEIKKCDN